VGKFTDPQIAAILRGTREFRSYAYPGTEGETAVRVAVRVLSDSEIDLARLQAQIDLREIAKARGWDPVSMTDLDPDHFERIVERQIVWRAFYDAATISREKPELFFPTAKDVAEQGAPMVKRLFALYLEHQAFVAPLRTASEEEVRELGEALGKGHGSPVLLDALERSTLIRLLLSTASALRSSSPTSR
jgi:hypothetical protein